MTKIKWKPEHFRVLDNIKVNFDVNSCMTDEQIIELDDKVSDYLAMHGLGKNDGVTPTGRICESILDLLSEL